MMHFKDYLLLLIVTFMSVVVVLPAASIMSGVNRNYLVVGLLIVVSIALVHYSKFVLVSAVIIVAIGANLPPEIAETFNIDARILVGSLIAVLLVPVINLIFKLPTGLDKPQGIPARHSSAAPNPEIEESNLADNTSPV